MRLIFIKLYLWRRPQLATPDLQQLARLSLNGLLVKGFHLELLAEHEVDSPDETFSIFVNQDLEACIVLTCIAPLKLVNRHFEELFWVGGLLEV